MLNLSNSRKMGIFLNKNGEDLKDNLNKFCTLLFIV